MVSVSWHACCILVGESGSEDKAEAITNNIRLTF